MKYFSILLALAAILATAGITNAQAPTALDGETYIFVMKNGNGLEEEIMDNLTFQGGQATSAVFAGKGFGSAVYTSTAARNASSGTGFAFTLQNGNESCVYDGVVEGDYISGSIEVTDKAGDKQTMYFRGATTPVWEQMKRGFPQNEVAPVKPQEPGK